MVLYSATYGTGRYDESYYDTFVDNLDRTLYYDVSTGVTTDYHDRTLYYEIYQEYDGPVTANWIALSDTVINNITAILDLEGIVPVRYGSAKNIQIFHDGTYYVCFYKK